MPYRILNIGPDAGVRRSLEELLKTDTRISVEHIETGTIGLDLLRDLPESQLPHIVILPFRLPILKAIDFIAEVHSHQRLQSICILVWGPDIPADEINQIYTAGAACVLPGKFSEGHMEALRQLCRDYTSDQTEAPRNKRRYAITSALRSTGKKAVQNARLGVLFVWTGCISTVFWICAFLQLGMSYTEADLAPLPVYVALASAGCSLMWTRLSEGARVQQ